MNSPRPSDGEIELLFDDYSRTRSRRVRNALVEAHMGFGVHMAKRFAGRGVGDEDLRQVAMLALVKAVDRFDPSRGIAFTTFAGRTIEGEIKRHFRDKSWSVRVPRSTKELHLQVRRASDELGQTLGRSPTVPEVAEHLDADVDDVVVALSAAAAYTPSSLEYQGSDSEGGADRSGRLAEVESGFEATDDHLLVERLCARLPERERKIVELRFFKELTQSEIAEAMGMSQMHVSRLLRRAFQMMRAEGDRDALEA